MAGRAEADWSKLNSTLYAVTFLAQQGSGKNCILCMESDHREEDCALAKVKSSSSWQKPNAGRDASLSSAEAGGRRVKNKAKMVCFSWNEGRCTYPYCHYRHVCVRCSGDHRITQCHSFGGSDQEGGRRRDHERESSVGRNRMSG